MKETLKIRKYPNDYAFPPLYFTDIRNLDEAKKLANVMIRWFPHGCSIFDSIPSRYG